MPAEYGVEQDSRTWRSYWGFPSHAEYFAQLRRIHSTPNDVCGLKLMWWQYEALVQDVRRYLDPGSGPSGVQALSAVLGPPRMIHLQRRDVLRQAVSWARAQCSGVWSRPADEPADGRPEAEFDAGMVRRCAHRIRTDNERWQEMLRTNDIEALDLWYEDLAADPSATTREILAFLGISHSADLSVTPRLRRLADGTTDAWLEAMRHQDTRFC